jgi:hypothetical protein
MTRNQRRKSSEVPSEVKIRKVVPEVPRDEAERGELLEDLQTMGCSGLLEKPWGFKDDRIVRELLDRVTNEFDNTIRATPTRWQGCLCVRPSVSSVTSDKVHARPIRVNVLLTLDKINLDLLCPWWLPHRCHVEWSGLLRAHTPVKGAHTPA